MTRKNQVILLQVQNWSVTNQHFQMRTSSFKQKLISTITVQNRLCFAHKKKLAG